MQIVPRILVLYRQIGKDSLMCEELEWGNGARKEC